MTSVGTHPRRSSKVRVAVLDDHQLIVDGLVARLSVPRARVNVVAGVTNWPSLVSHPEFPVDVVLLEVNLDDGIPIATKLQTLSAADVCSIVVSWHTDATTVHGVLRAGASAFVGKNESAEELVATIHAVASGRERTSPTVERALAEYAAREDPNLGRQEQRALVLYAGGRSIHEVASDMQTTDETVKSYIKRGRRKYRSIGIDLGTKILLRRHAIREGWIEPE
jgi:two-component system, NarL family, uhpT operon response regulator UhpA